VGANDSRHLNLVLTHKSEKMDKTRMTQVHQNVTFIF
jgi:hypothetical protein